MGANRKKVIILGCTGSIGTSALKGIGMAPDQFEIVALSAHKNFQKLSSILQHYPVGHVCLSDSVETNVAFQVPHNTKLYRGSQGLLEMIRAVDADIVLNGIIGAAGLEPTIAGIETKKDIALANKETLVMAGPLILDLAKANNVHVFPVDSEHAAIHALLKSYGKDSIASIILTASGGPFRTLAKEKFSSITVAQAIAHPTWKMGPKISVDSATLANKGLEVIEASVLFGMQAKQIEVVIHPQSIVHSLIRLRDGSLYAQLSKPDMVHPIMQALAHDLPPLENLVAPLDFSNLSLQFSSVDEQRWPMVSLAYRCVELKGSYAIAFNAANEVAVNRFVQHHIPFTGISDMVHAVLDKDWSFSSYSVEEVIATDAKARALANAWAITQEPS